MPPYFIWLRSFMAATIKWLNSSSATDLVDSELRKPGDKTGLGIAGLHFQIYKPGSHKNSMTVLFILSDIWVNLKYEQATCIENLTYHSHSKSNVLVQSGITKNIGPSFKTVPYLGPKLYYLLTASGNGQ
jgi:hypothetical protein